MTLGNSQDQRSHKEQMKMGGQVEDSKVDSTRVEAEDGKDKSPLRRFLHDVARDLAVVCAGLCFLHMHVSCIWSGLIGSVQFFLVLIIFVMSLIARWWIGLFISILLFLVFPMFFPIFCH